MRWLGPAWSELEESVVRAEVYKQVEEAFYWRATKEGGELRKWAPNRHKVADLLDAMTAVALLPSTVQPPAWVEGPGPAQVISVANGLLDVTYRRLLVHDPRFFNLVSVPFAYQADAGDPVEWERFLDSVWDDLEELKQALQMWFGYVLSGRLDLDKMLMLPGPPRAGKRVIASVLSALIGKLNVAGITLARLSEQFGLADLIHKPLAVIPDARVGRDSRVVVERLLSITGEDRLNIERKYRDDWSGQLPTRLMMLTNELPNFRDASGALANRFLVLELTKSWLGHEDTGLEARLMTELPAVLNWALDGLEALSKAGRFIEPQSSRDAVSALIDIASPVAAFVRERCLREPKAEVLCDTLRDAWKSWCDENGDKPGNTRTFGRDLKAVIPTVKQFRPRLPDGTERPYHYRGIALLEQT